MAPASINSGYLDKVWEIRTLGKTRDAEAKKMLEDVAKLVEPIMRKRKWQVKLLSEFRSEALSTLCTIVRVPNADELVVSSEKLTLAC